MKKKSFSQILVISLIIGVFTLTGCGSTPPVANPSSSTPPVVPKVLKVGSDIAYAPFEFMDATMKPVGFDIDLMDAIAKDMGYTTKYETSGFDGLPLTLSSGKYDAAISAMTITPKRAESVLFSDPYFLANQYIAVKKDSSIKSVKDLKGKRVGVQNTTTGQDAVVALGINPKKYDSTPDALTDLVNGSLDAVVADSPVVLYFIKEKPSANIVAIQGDFPKEYYGIAMKLDNKDLATKLNASLKTIISNGKYDVIYKKWFNAEAPKLN